MSVSVILKSARLPFLVLTPVCVFLGFSLAVANGANVEGYLALLVMTGALLAHISVNALNEYFDFKSGLDFLTSKTPFSGGSGALPDEPKKARAVLISGLVTLLITALLGIYFIGMVGFKILPFGLFGIFLIIAYTQWINKLPIVCLLAPGLGFGFLMVLGTELVLSKNISILGVVVSLIPFFLTNNLLLLNQYPDVEADKKVGRRTFPISYGYTASNFMYGLFCLLAYGLVILLVVFKALPQLSLVALLPAALNLFSLKGTTKHGFEIGKHPKYLAANVVATLATPGFLGLSILAG